MAAILAELTSVGNIADLSTSSPLTYTWVIINGQTRPMLAMEYSTTITNAHQLELVNADLTATYTLANNLDLTPSMTNAADIWGTNTNASTGTGFVPIGYYGSFFRNI